MTGITLLNEFNANAVSRELDIAPGDRAAHCAISYLFNHIQQEYFSDKTLAAKKSAVDATVQVTELAYDLMAAHSSDFFLGEAYDKDALTLAVICNDTIATANSSIGKACFPFDAEGRCLHAAEKIWHAALEIADGHGKQGRRREAVFLAHIHAIETLRDGFDDMYRLEEDDDIQKIEIRLRALRTFIEPETEIGQALQGYADRLCQLFRQAPDPATRRMFLTAQASNDLT